MLLFRVVLAVIMSATLGLALAEAPSTPSTPPATIDPQALPPRSTENAKIIVISVVGTKPQRVIRSYEAETGDNYGTAATSRGAEFALARARIKGEARPELSATQSVDRVAASSMAAGADRSIELEMARTIKAELPGATIGFITRGKDRFTALASDLPSDKARKKIAVELKLLSEVVPADRYVLVSPYQDTDWTGLDGATTAGLGWFVNRGLRFVDITDPEEELETLDTHLASFVFLRTSVFDGKTFEMIDTNATTANRKLPMAKQTKGFDPWSGTKEADRNQLMKGLIADTMKRAAKRAIGIDPNVSVDITEISTTKPTASSPGVEPAPTSILQPKN